MNARSILISTAFAVVLCLPGFARAQVGRTVAIPSVWAADAGDQVLAAELTNALKAAVSTVPDWTVSGLDIQLSELMRACQTPDHAASEECMAHMAAARDSSVADDLIVFAGLFNRGGALRLTLSIYDAVDGASPGSIEVPVERILSLAERNHLASSWLNQLARLIAPLPTTPEAITAEASTAVILGLDSTDGDDEFANVLTNALRAVAAHSTRWTFDAREVSLANAMLGFACEEPMIPDADCLGRMASHEGRGFGADQMVFGTLHRVGEGASLRMVLELSLFDARVHRVTRGFSMELTVEEIMTISDRERIAAECIARLTSTQEAGDPLIAHRYPTPVDQVLPVPVHPASSGGGFDLEYVAWPLIGIAGASLVLEIVSWAMIGNVQSDPDFMALRASYGAGTGNVCNQAPTGMPGDAHAHSLCGTASDWENVEIAFGVIGGAALAGGLTTLILDLMGGHQDERTALRITPQVSSRSAMLAVSLDF